MFNKLKKGEFVIVCGYGEEDGTLYINKVGIVIERDPYYKDYLVQFENGTEDWFLPKYLQKVNI